MNEHQRSFLEVKNGLSSSFWFWLRNYLKEQSDECRDAGVNLVPATPQEVIEREQLFGKARALKDLIDEIPNKIKEDFAALEKDKQEE